MILTKIMIRHSHSKMSIQRIKRGCWNIIIIMYRKTVTFWEMLAMNTDVWRVLGNYKYILKLRKSLLFRLYLNIKNQFIIQWKRETQEQDICFNRGGKIIICLPSVQYAPYTNTWNIRRFVWKFLRFDMDCPDIDSCLKI